MASTAWRGTDVKVTSGSRTVEVTRNADTDDISKVKVNGNFVASNFSLPYEVERTYTTGETDFIVLKELWQGASGSGLNAVVATSPATIEEARLALVNLISIYESFADNVSPAVTADSVVQRTSAGRIKTANAVSSDEAVAYGQLGSAATKNVGIDSGNVLGVQSGGRVGVGTSSPESKAHVVSLGSDATVRVESTSNSGGQLRTKNTAGDYTTGVTGGTNGNYIIYDVGNAETMAEYSPVQGWDFRTGGIERLTITQAGDIGIGTANPQAKLHVRDSSSPNILVNDSNGRTGYFGVNSTANTVQISSDSALPFVYKSNTIERLRVDGSKMLINGFTAYHQGNSLGLGNTSKEGDIPDTENINVNRFGRITAASSGSKPFATNYNILNMASSAATNTTIALSWTGAGGIPQMWLRSQSTSYSDWVQMYHTGNTNFNEFGAAGSASRSLIVDGFGISSTEIEFIFRVSSYNRPSSMSVQGNLVVRDNTDTTSFTFSPELEMSSARSTPKTVAVICSNLEGITEGARYKLMTNSTDAKITFNL